MSAVVAPKSVYAVKASCVTLASPDNAMVGAMLSSTVTVAAAVAVLPLTSVTTKLTAFCPKLAQSYTLGWLVDVIEISSSCTFVEPLPKKMYEFVSFKKLEPALVKSKPCPLVGKVPAFPESMKKVIWLPDLTILTLFFPSGI